MNAFKCILCVGALSLALLVCPRTEAGRTGGPASEVGTMAAGQVVSFDVPFDEGRAVIRASATGPGPIEIDVYDGDGNLTMGKGSNRRRTAIVNVYRAGTFRIDVRNNGTMATDIRIETN